MLASLDTVLWEGSGWAKPGMADLVEKGRVKRAYMRANLVVHPDKVAQKGGTTEQVHPLSTRLQSMLAGQDDVAIVRLHVDADACLVTAQTAARILCMP